VDYLFFFVQFSHDAMEVNDSAKSQSIDVSAQSLTDDKLVSDVADADTSIISTSGGIENVAGMYGRGWWKEVYFYHLSWLCIMT